jgi:hypothetical protein
MVSGPGIGFASGGVLGQTGIGVWPETGFQVVAFACAYPHVPSKHKAKRNIFTE